MAFTFTCDYCGGEILRSRKGKLKGYVTVSLDADKSRQWSSGYKGHYHDDCYETLDDLLDMAREVGMAIEALPTLPDAPDPRGGFPVGDDYRRRRDAGRPLADMPLPENVQRALRAANLVTLEEVATRTKAEIGEVRGVGHATVRRLQAAMAEAGLSFRNDTGRKEMGING